MNGGFVWKLSTVPLTETGGNIMTDTIGLQVACDILDDADVLHEFEDSVVLRIDRELWLQYLRTPVPIDYPID